MSETSCGRCSSNGGRVHGCGRLMSVGTCATRETVVAVGIGEGRVDSGGRLDWGRWITQREALRVYWREFGGYLLCPSVDVKYL